MARMTNKQIDYALERLGSIAFGLRAWYEAPEKLVKPDDEELLVSMSKNKDLFTTGEFQEAAKTAIHGQTYYRRDGFFNKLRSIIYERIQVADGGVYESTRAVYDENIGRIDKEMQRVQDEIMLGDVEVALKLLEKFAEFE